MLRRIVRAFSPAAFFLLAFVVVLLTGRGAAPVDQLATGGGEIDPVPTTAPLAAPDQVPTPTALAVPTATAIPPTPTPSPTPQPTATPTPAPSPTSAPTATPEPPPAPTATPPPTATTVPTETPTPLPATPAPSTATPDALGGETAAPLRTVHSPGPQPLAQAGPVTLLLPVQQVEVIGFHEAGHPGSLALTALSSDIEMFTMASRGRGTHPRSAADIVAPVGVSIVAPTTGTVVAAKSYVLYCEHQDGLVYIEPDGLPGWQVRVFHVEGISVAPGARVIAGETPIATSVRLLPFESQVDEFTAEPSWPHVHLEVVDTNVPDTRPPGAGCPT